MATVTAPPEYGPVVGEQIRRAEDLRDLFVTPFYFGCEARRPGERLGPRPAHQSVRCAAQHSLRRSDMRDVPEAYELLEDNLVSAEDFRDFTFANAVRFCRAGNPRFLAIEKDAAGA